MKYMNTYHNVSITVKIKRRFPTYFICEKCDSVLNPPGQSRVYNKETKKYTCYNFYTCVYCGYEFKSEPEIVNEYEPYPRLDDNCFMERIQEVILPISPIYGDIVDVEFVKVNKQ